MKIRFLAIRLLPEAMEYAYLLWARSGMHPLHPSIPELVIRLAELHDKLGYRTATELPRVSQTVRPDAAGSETRNEHAHAKSPCGHNRRNRFQRWLQRPAQTRETYSP